MNPMLGWAMIVLLFAALFAFAAMEEGVRFAVFVFALTAGRLRVGLRRDVADRVKI